MSAILSVVRILTETKSNWDQGARGDDLEEWEVPLETPQYIGNGGAGYTENIQRAQIFGWSPSAKRNLSRYRDNPKFEVVAVNIVPETV